jgi:hypothetical protein
MMEPRRTIITMVKGQIATSLVFIFGVFFLQTLSAHADGISDDNGAFPKDANSRKFFIPDPTTLNSKKRSSLVRNSVNLLTNKNTKLQLREGEEQNEHQLGRIPTVNQINRGLVAVTAGKQTLAPIAQATLPSNPTQIENALPSQSGWEDWAQGLSEDIAQNGEIEGFASTTSVNKGGTIRFYVSSKSPTYTWELYRLGWYGGSGGRLMIPATRVNAPSGGTLQRQIPAPVGVITVNGQPQDDLNNLNMGLVDARAAAPGFTPWPESFNIVTSTQWTSGVYLIKLKTDPIASNGNRPFIRYIIFALRDDTRASDYLFQMSATTYQAYNNWGGKSLYGSSSIRSVPAYKVSFNRPYQNNSGTGDFFAWEIHALYFLEREGYDVTYATNIDIHNSSQLPLNHKAVLTAGHDEYWTWQERINMENARASGINLAFLGGNDAYWEIRLENSNRTIVGYKEQAGAKDPLATNASTADDYLITTLWRAGGTLSTSDPIINQVPQFQFPNRIPRPEDSLVGTMYHAYPVNNHIVIRSPVEWTDLRHVHNLNGDVQIPMALTTPATLIAPTNIRITPPTANWVYANTDALGFILNDWGPHTFFGLLGYETNSASEPWNNPPAGTQIISHTPDWTVNQPGFPADPDKFADMTIYPWPNVTTPKSYVFSAGNIQWSWGLDDYLLFLQCKQLEDIGLGSDNHPPGVNVIGAGYTCNASNVGDDSQFVSAEVANPEVQQIMRNILTRFAGH